MSRIAVSSTSLASTSASFTRARLQPGVLAATGTKAADLQQIGDLIEGEAQTLRCFDHPQHRDRLGRIEAVTTEGSIRLVQQAAAFVVAQGLNIDPGRVGHLATA